MGKQTHFEVRRHHGRTQIDSRMRATEPHKRAIRRRELVHSAAICAAVLLVSLAGAAYLITQPLHH